MTFQLLKTFTMVRFQAARIESHPLFARMQDDAFSPEERRSIGTQFFHVVDFFPRFLAALIANVDDLQARMPLVENLYEEHGRMRLAHAHVVTFRNFLHALELSDAEIDASRPSIGVLAYRRGVLDVCSRATLPEAFAAIGAIEEIVARVSPIVAQYGARRTSAHLGTHFSLHEKLDLSHADELYALAAPWFTEESGLVSPSASLRPGDAVRRGVDMGIYFQTRLYDDILAGLAPLRSGARA